MNLTGFTAETRKRSSSGVLQRGIRSAQNIIGGDGIFPTRFGVQDALIVSGIIGAVGLVALGYLFGLPTTQVFAQSLSTEYALTGFSAVAGLGGFLGTFIASSQLASIPGGTVNVGSLALPVAVTFLGNFVAGLLFPSA